MTAIGSSVTLPFEAGKEVYLYSTGMSSPIERATISRVTKTQAIIDRGHYEQRFNRETGRIIGGSGATWGQRRLSRSTPALDKLWAEQQLRNAKAKLMHAASKEDAGAIREAYARWDALQTESETTNV